MKYSSTPHTVLFTKTKTKTRIICLRFGNTKKKNIVNHKTNMKFIKNDEKFLKMYYTFAKLEILTSFLKKYNSPIIPSVLL